MLSSRTGMLITLGALALFAAVGVAAARRAGLTDRDRYLTARGTQGPGALALSFFASALGAWILFSPPEVGTFGGFLGVFGYAAGQALAIAVFAWLGPPVRARLPEGATILDLVRLRFGRIQQAYVGAISVLYMFVFLAAELTAIGGVLGLLAGTGRAVPIVAVAAITVAYTAYGGLPASIATDRWQGWLILALLAVGAGAVLLEVGEPARRAGAGGLWKVTRGGAEVMVTLVVAITAANLFHQGLWQRVWAARDRASLVRGALGGAALILPVVFLLGAAGAVAAGAGRVGDQPSVAFFALLDGLPAPVLGAVVALAVALVASSVDTLQNGLTSLVAAHVARVSLPVARAITVLLTIPAAAVALMELSVLRLFLIADLLAATIAFPVFLGLWRRASAVGALAGSVAGLLAVVVLGWIRSGSAADGVLLLTLPEGPSLGAFVVAPLASAAVTILVSLVRPARQDDVSPRSGGGSGAAPPPSG